MAARVLDVAHDERLARLRHAPRDVEEARSHPLLKDQYFTTGSFISFPLIYRGELVGVVNLTNRAQRGLYHEEDVERVRLLGLVISLVAQRSRLPERLLEALGVG